VHHLLHGDIVLALRHNSLMFLVAPLFVAEALVRIRRVEPSVFASVWVGRIVVAFFITFAIARNVPIWPFLWLAPPM